MAARGAEGFGRLADIRHIIAQVADKFRMPVESLLSDSRNGRLVLARWEAMYRAYSETSFSSVTIGQYLNRDHATVLHGVMRYAQLRGRPRPRNSRFVLRVTGSGAGNEHGQRPRPAEARGGAAHAGAGGEMAAGAA